MGNRFFPSWMEEGKVNLDPLTIPGKVAKSKIEDAVVKYNADVAKLGALAGADLSMLRGIIPDPTSWASLSYDAWKQTMESVKEGMQEDYQLIMGMRGFNVSGNQLGNAPGRAALSAKSKLTKENQSIAERLAKKSGAK
jgi:hypothetical protein